MLLQMSETKGSLHPGPAFVTGVWSFSRERQQQQSPSAWAGEGMEAPTEGRAALLTRWLLGLTEGTAFAKHSKSVSLPFRREKKKKKVKYFCIIVYYSIRLLCLLNTRVCECTACLWQRWLGLPKFSSEDEKTTVCNL